MGWKIHQNPIYLWYETLTSRQTQYSDVLNSANKEQNNPIVRDEEIYNWFTSIHYSWMGTQAILGASPLTRAYLAYKVLRL